MTLEQLESWIKEHNLKSSYRNFFHGVFHNNKMFLSYRKIYNKNKYNLTVFTLKYEKYRICSYAVMIKELDKFDIVDLNYYFEEFKKKEEFIELYSKQIYIHKRKQALAQDFS